jgi:hypothetical protein
MPSYLEAHQSSSPRQLAAPPSPGSSSLTGPPRKRARLHFSAEPETSQGPSSYSASHWKNPYSSDEDEDGRDQEDGTIADDLTYHELQQRILELKKYYSKEVNNLKNNKRKASKAPDHLKASKNYFTSLANDLTLQLCNGKFLRDSSVPMLEIQQIRDRIPGLYAFIPSNIAGHTGASSSQGSTSPALVTQQASITRVTGCLNVLPSIVLCGSKPSMYSAHRRTYIANQLATDSEAPLSESKWADGLAIANIELDGWSIIALNVDWIPRPVLGRVEIQIREDGRFGLADHLNHPQPYCATKPYLALIPRRPALTHPCAVLWDCPGINEFVRANDHPDGEAYGWLESSRLESLIQSTNTIWPLVKAFENRSRLCLGWGGSEEVREDRRQHVLGDLKASLKRAIKMFDIPCTYRDLVRQWGHLHRCFAECWAWLCWQDILLDVHETFGEERRLRPSLGIDHSGVMGVFCTDAFIAHKWLEAGVPVWLLQHAFAARPTRCDVPKVALSEPADVVQNRISTVTAPVMRVTVGDAQMQAIWRLSETVLDVERIPLSSNFEPTAASAVAQPSSSVVAPQEQSRSSGMQFASA